MGLFDILKKPMKIKDPVFGELTTDYHFLLNANFFFAPTNSAIELIIDAEKEVNEGQRDFYLAIERRYTEIKKMVEPLMIDLFKNWKEDFKIKDFDKEFPLIGIKLPAVKSQPIVWEMTYNSIYDDHEFTVTFHDFQPKSEIAING